MFRNSELPDIDAQVSIAESAKALLKSRGVSQWQRGTYPDRSVFLADVSAGIGYVLEEGGEVAAFCAVTLTEEPSYRHLTSGTWLTAEGSRYATIHRSAVAEKFRGRGLAGKLFAEVEEMVRPAGAVSIRVDTHQDNIAMQHALERAGFVRCCELILVDGDEVGDPRLGYEKILQE